MAGRVGHTTARQIYSQAAIAAVRSEAVQACSVQAVMLEAKVLLLQRQAWSVAEQPPRLVEAKHALAQAGSDDSIR